MNPNQSLMFLRKADNRTRPSKGFLYRHRWNGGAQDLVFSSHADAEAFAKSVGTRIKPPEVEHIPDARELAEYAARDERGGNGL